MARIFEVLDATPEIRDPENSLPLDPEAVEGRVVFEHVSQSYPFMISPMTRTIKNPFQVESITGSSGVEVLQRISLAVRLKSSLAFSRPKNAYER